MSANVLVLPEGRAAASGAPAAVRVGLLGCGVVGSAVARVLLGEGERVAAAAGARIELARVAVKHLGKARAVDLPPGLLCDDAGAVVDDPTVDVVVEVIGGVDLPRHLVRRAAANGKAVVTANKELLAQHGHGLATATRDARVDLLFEGAVGGAIPIAAALRDRLGASRPVRVTGVVNGTTNFVLELMGATGCTQREAVAEAQRHGYAEADPGADLDGRDAAAKIAILASLAFDAWVPFESATRRGIEGIEHADVACAHEAGYAVKLVATAARRDGPPHVAVTPALVPEASSLARLSGVANEVIVDCGAGGSLAFRGPGAGGDATAGAVVGDLVVAARNLARGTRSPLVTRAAPSAPAAPEPAARHFVRAPGAHRDDASLAEAAAASGVRVTRAMSAALGDGLHLGLLTEDTSPSRAAALRAALAGRGLRPWVVLPVLEVA